MHHVLIDMGQHGIKVITICQVSIDRRHLAEDAVEPVHIVMQRHVATHQLREAAPMAGDAPSASRALPGVRGLAAGLITRTTAGPRRQALVPKI